MRVVSSGLCVAALALSAPAWAQQASGDSATELAKLTQNPVASLISVPQKPERVVGLSLSEESLGEVHRYVLLYMPAAAALIAWHSASA